MNIRDPNSVLKIFFDVSFPILNGNTKCGANSPVIRSSKIKYESQLSHLHAIIFSPIDNSAPQLLHRFTFVSPFLSALFSLSQNGQNISCFSGEKTEFPPQFLHLKIIMITLSIHRLFILFAKHNFSIIHTINNCQRL